MADAAALVEIVGKESVSGPAGVAVGALSAVEAAAGKTGGAFASLASTVVKTAAAVATLSATGIIAGLTAATTAAAGFEKQMSAVGAVSGASAQQMKDLSALALKLGADTSFSASESAQGIGELVKAGVSIADVMGGAAKASLDLAAAGGVDVATAAEIASNAMNVFSIQGKDMAHVADEIAGAANASAIDVNDYKFSLAQAGSVAATVGINFDDLTTAIAVMGQAGLKGAMAGDSLKVMMLNLTPQSKAATKEMQDLGIITADGANKFFDASGKAKSLAEISGVLQAATKNLTEEQRVNALHTLFGTNAIQAATIMAKNGAGGFTEMAAAIGKVSSSDVANTRLDNLAGSIEKFKGSAETAAITVGQHLLPPLRRLVDIATDLVNKSLPTLDRFGAVLGTAFDHLIDQALKAAPAMRAAGESVLNLGRYFAELRHGGDYLNDWLTHLPSALQGPVEMIGHGLSAAVIQFHAALELIGPTVERMVVGFKNGGLEGAIGAALPVGMAIRFHVALIELTRTFGQFSAMAVPALKLVGQHLEDYIISNVRFLTTYVLPAFYDAAVETFGFFRDVGPTLAHIAGVLHEQFGVTLIWLADEAWPNLLSIARQTVEWFDRELLPLIPGIADALRVNLGGALYWLATTGWPALLAAGAAVSDWVTGTAIPALVGLVDWLGPKVSAAVQWLIATGWPGLVSAATTVTDWVAGTALPALSSLWDWLSPKLAAALGWLTDTGWPTLVTTATTVTDWVTGIAVPALSSLVDWLGPKISDAVSWLTSTGWPTLVTAATAVTDWVTGTAVPALSSLWDWLSPKLSAALGWLTETGWPTFVTAATAVSDWITQTAIPALTPLVEWLNEKLGAAVAWLIETGWPTFVTAATAASDWMTQTAVPALSDLWSWLEEKTRPAVQWFIDTGWPELERLGRIAVNMWSDMVAWTEKLWDRLRESGVITSVTTSLGLLWDAGKILVETFWPQMTSGAGDAFTAIDPLVTLLKGAAGFLRAFAEGVHAIAEGFKFMHDNPPPDWFLNILRGMPGGSLVAGALQSGAGSSQAPSAGQSSQPGTSTTGTASATKGKIDNSSRASFVRTAYPYMLEAAGGNKDLAEMMLAAAISENGDVGKGGDFVGNNFFGIKGKGPTGKSNSLDTWEWEGGRRVNQKAEFAAYDDPVQGFQGFMDFLRKNSRYAGALNAFQQTGDAQTLFNGINAAGYATDPNWASTIGNIRANQVAPVTATVPTTMNATSSDAALAPLHEIIAVLGKDVPDATATAQQSITSFAADTRHRFQMLAADSQVDISEMADGLVTQITDAAGNVTSTVTDMNGNVVRQFASMADGTMIATGDMGTSLTESLDKTSGLIDTVMTDAAGNVVETVTDMAGTVLLQTATMADTAGASFGAVGTAATNTVAPLDAFSQTIGALPTPNLQPTADQFGIAEQAAKDAQKAAEEYASYLSDIDNFDWDSATNSKKPREYTPASSDNHRAGGGPVWPGTWLVGEDGPELLTLGSGQYGGISNNRDTQRALGGGIDHDALAKAIARELAGVLPTRGDVNVYGAGTEEVAQKVIRHLRRENSMTGVRR